MRILVTGSEGFVGWHLRSFLLTKPGLEVSTAGRSTFADPGSLAAAVAGRDVIVHLAGVNRATDAEIMDGNINAAKALAAACVAADCTPHVIFASSTHVERSPRSAYGEAKLRAAAILSDWASRSNAAFTELVIPHVFGEHGRPFYNSAIATFCHQLSSGETPTIQNDIELELVHVQDLCEEIFLHVMSHGKGAIRLTGMKAYVSDLLSRLQSMRSIYEGGVLPDLSDPFSLRLFNTLRSFYYPQRYPWNVALHSDDRGRLFETVKTLSGGQCFLSTTRPGVTRGNHFHRHKFERFMVVGGKATIRIRRLLSAGPLEFHLDGASPAFVDIPTLHTHEITNTGREDLLTLFWAHEIFDTKNPDTFAHPVNSEAELP